ATPAFHDSVLWYYVNDQLPQQGDTSTLVSTPASPLQYISQFITLLPGDVVLTGTPGGVGVGQSPPRLLQDGDSLRTEISGLGVLENRFKSTVETAVTRQDFQLKH